jgi:uroporphyrinogen decarboxylase
MNLRKKVEAAFCFKEVRPTPYTVWYDEESGKKLDFYYGGGAWREKIKNHIQRVTVDWRPRRYIGEGVFTDVHGSVWKEGDPEHLVEPVLKSPDIGQFTVPSYVQFMTDPGREAFPRPSGRLHLPLREIPQYLEKLPEPVYTVVDYGYGLFESAWMIRGYQEFFMDLILEPSFAHSLLDQILERQLEVIDALVGLPCDAIMFIDDYGDQRTVAVGPETWRTFFKPRLKSIYERIHAGGKKTFHHSCGNVYEIVPDLIEIGLDVLQSVQPEAMPVYELKKNFGNSLCFWGGLGTQQLLPFGTPEQIRSEVRKLKSELGKNGGYVFTSAKPIMRDVPVENAAALIEASIAPE